MLELPTSRYDEAFGAAGSPTALFTNVLNAHRVNELGPDVVRVLAATSELGNVCFVVRAADVGSLVAYDNHTDDSDRVYFALQ